MVWEQVYNPLNSVALSTIVAALPIVVLLGTLAFLRMKAHWSAILGLIASLVSSTNAPGTSGAGGVAAGGRGFGGTGSKPPAAQG